MLTYYEMSWSSSFVEPLFKVLMWMLKEESWQELLVFLMQSLDVSNTSIFKAFMKVTCYNHVHFLSFGMCHIVLCSKYK